MHATSQIKPSICNANSTYGTKMSMCLKKSLGMRLRIGTSTIKLMTQFRNPYLKISLPVFTKCIEGVMFCWWLMKFCIHVVFCSLRTDPDGHSISRSRKSSGNKPIRVSSEGYLASLEGVELGDDNKVSLSKWLIVRHWWEINHVWCNCQVHPHWAVIL